jgi:hypothetical protein
MQLTQLRQILLFTFSALSTFALPAPAESVVRIHWSDFCRVTAGTDVTVTTLDGNHIEGRCLKVDVDEIELSSTTKGGQGCASGARRTRRVGLI